MFSEDADLVEKTGFSTKLWIVLDWWMLSGGRQKRHSRWLVLQRESSDDQAEFWSVAQPYLHIEPNWGSTGCYSLQMSADRMQTSLKYAGPEPRTQSKAVSATLNCIRWGTAAVEIITKDWSDTVKLAGTNNQTGGSVSTICSADSVWLMLIRRIERHYNSEPGRNSQTRNELAAARVHRDSSISYLEGPPHTWSLMSSH